MPRRHPALVPLSREHRDALGLAFRLHNPAPPGPVTPMTPESTPSSRATETIEFFDRSLVRHFRTEENLLFPFLRELFGESPEIVALVTTLVDEHEEMKRLVDELRGHLASGEPADATLTAFADLLESHVRVEERRLFADVPSDLADDRTANLEEALREALDAPPT